jgi:FHA domain
MLAPGFARNRLASVLGTAFAGGLLSEDTLSHRLGVLFNSRLVDPRSLIGDLSMRKRRRRWSSTTAGTFAGWRRMILRQTTTQGSPLVLALGWASADEDLLLGRDPDCDIRFVDDSVSRRHARLVIRDGAWVIQDLGSTNGTIVNGSRVGRCQLQVGDRVQLGDQRLDID